MTLSHPAHTLLAMPTAQADWRTDETLEVGDVSEYTAALSNQPPDQGAHWFKLKPIPTQTEI